MFLIFKNSCRFYSKSLLTLDKAIPSALIPKKPKTKSQFVKHFLDTKTVCVSGGKGGDGCVSFLQVWCNERAGTDGGDGGNGGHVVFQASKDVANLNQLPKIIRGEDGQCGKSEMCHGKNAKHSFINVPIGTVVRNKTGLVIGHLDREHIMFVAAKGGAGGKGNKFFTTDRDTSPKICEYGQHGEDKVYILEMRSMANIGIIGFPNAGKSTLLNSITRARSKVAPYSFTTLRPQIGMVNYADHFQLAVADLPGILSGSHANKGLGLQFLKHIERCTVLVYLLDASFEDPIKQYQELSNEISKFSQKLACYPKIIVANKIDKPDAALNITKLKTITDVPIIGISAKEGTNLNQLLNIMRRTYENTLSESY